MALTLEQYKALRAKGVSPELISKFENGYVPGKQIEKPAIPEKGFMEETFEDISQTGSALKETYKKTVGKMGEAVAAGIEGKQSGVRTLGQAVGTGAGGISQGIGDVIIGAAKTALPQSYEDTIKKGISDVATPIMQSETVKNIVAKYEALNPKQKRDVDALVGVGSFIADIFGAGVGKKAATKAVKVGQEAVDTTLDVAKATKTKAGQVISNIDTTLAKNVMKDIKPTKAGVVSSEINKALDLTQGDIKNIKLSTGNNVGEFIAKENLIGNTVDETSKKLSTFYKENYKKVRDEIKKVDTVYKASDAPRYKEAMTSIKKQIDEVPGLQKANEEVDALLAKETINLSDIQRVKELMDEHFSLYKATGDVKESVAKQGLANIRKDLREFIEKEVADKTKTDIRLLNNNVSTSRSIIDAIETRATRGSTRATISAGDVAVFLTGNVASPIGGIAVVALKRIYQSPAFKLRLSKWLNSLSQAEKVSIKKSIEKGIMPKKLLAQSSLLAKKLSIESPIEPTKKITNKKV